MSASSVSHCVNSPPVKGGRFHAAGLLLLMGTFFLGRVSCTLQTETQHTHETEAQQNSAATNAKATEQTNAEHASSNVSPPAASAFGLSEREADVQEVAVADAESASVPAVIKTASSTAAAELHSPDSATLPQSEGEEAASDLCNSCSEDGELASNEPAARAERSDRVPRNPVTALQPRSASTTSSGNEADEAFRVQKRHKKRSSRQETLCRHKRCYYLADSAFVSSAHLLPPPPDFMPPQTPEGRAFMRAVKLCHDSSFNLNVGKKFIYLISSAVTYFQQSRVKCAIAYAQMFREEDVPMPSEEVLDACAVALLRHSPDECWIDVPDPRVVFMQAAPGTRLIGPPANKGTNLQGVPVNTDDEISRRQFKRAERLTLTLFKFSLTSRTHWCPPCKNVKSSTEAVRTPKLLPKQGYEGPKHEAWRQYLDALNEEVTRDLTGILLPEGEESAAEDTVERAGSVRDETILVANADDEGAKDVFFSANFELAPPWAGSRRVLAAGQSWLSRGGTPPPERKDTRYRPGGRLGLGKIPAGAVFGGLTNPISRYAALLNYLQSRYNFQRLKYEFEEEDLSTTPSGRGSTSANARDDNSSAGTTQTLTLRKIDVANPFGGTMRAGHDTASGRQFFTLEPSNIKAEVSRRPRKHRSSCDLMPLDQAAEAAKAALGCGGDCVDTGEDLYKILRDGTDTPPADFRDTFWSQSDDSFRPTRLPRHPTAESLLRAYLTQVVSSCGTSQIHLREADRFYFAQAARLHFFGRFHDKCLQAMDEMTLPLFRSVFADDSRGRNVGMPALQQFLPVPAPYSGADQLLINCAAAALVASAMPPTSLSNAAASAEAIAAAAAAGGAAPWSAPTRKARAALEAPAFAYHHPVRGLMSRGKFAPRIPCWELDATRLPPSMSQTEFKAVVTSFADLELRSIPLPDRRFLDEQLVPKVLQSLLEAKLPARIFLGYKSPAARAYVLARYLRARFKLGTPEEAGWGELPPATLSVEDQTVKAAEVAVNCGAACTDMGLSVEELVHNGLEPYLKTRRAMRHEGVEDTGRTEKNRSAYDYTDDFVPDYEVDEETPFREPPSTRTGQNFRENPRRTAPASRHPPAADSTQAAVFVQKNLMWIPAVASFSAVLI